MWPKNKSICLKPWPNGPASSRKWTQVFSLRQLASPFGQGLMLLSEFQIRIPNFDSVFVTNFLIVTVPTRRGAFRVSNPGDHSIFFLSHFTLFYAYVVSSSVLMKK